ncbi:MAG: nicotinate-nucleotide adenylyltransferase [Planctomycetota bacterium]
MTDTSLASNARIGILGGTFDPVHLGHLLLAEQARIKLELNQVWFLPAAVSPLKQDASPRATDRQRLEMLELATGGNPFFRIDPREIHRGGTSYTVDTLRELRSEQPDAKLFFLMGADSLVSLKHWKEPKEICELVQVIVLSRGGHPAPEHEQLGEFIPGKSAEELSKQLLPMPQMEISSSELREDVKAGRSTRYQLHPAVEVYIAGEGLYR